jgi:hypothetical protein
MLIRQKFNELKKEIREIYDKDENNILNLSRNSVSELAQGGYILRKVETFMFLNDFPESEVNKFFADECTGIDVLTLGPVEPEDADMKIFEFISMIKTETVKCRLWFDLVGFLCMIKEENINKN